ncbi:hypothetical protein HC231_15915 [Brenneria izadpanahii]|uniref:Uncharacterized protein n=1 Tax=Brenneria izadpanahii TaxID=2722756 RepID=A0ABX7UV89_9GAMM|nr:YfaZ family outer membrane protein [Brenneria izadpanahii]QTF09220.1 hypothetical protein HC231_15915 [Brenneria izadpanahii]
MKIRTKMAVKSPVRPLTLKAGYRYICMDGKNERPNQRLVEGPYVGEVSF